MISNRIKTGIVLLMTSLVILINVTAKVPATEGDSYGTLLVADSLVRFGKFSLENYPREILDRYGPRISKTQGLPFYYFPLGSSILSVPLVGMARLLGIDVLSEDAILQRIMASMSSVLTLLLMLRIGYRWRDDWAAWLVPGLFWFGTVLSVSTGTALESHDFAIVFALLAIDRVLGMRDEQSIKIWGGVGCALFLAYLTRPTFALLSPFLLIWLFTLSRPVALKAGLVVFALLGCFVLFSLKIYGQPLPDYYIPKRLSGGDPRVALIGNLISPARGLLVFSSFIVVIWLFPKQAIIQRGRGWLFVAIVWPIAHWIVVSRFPHWWGGHSYGPRLMIDCFPGLLLLLLTRWPSLSKVMTYQIRSAVLLLSMGFSVFANTWQGMFNLYTAHWSNAPDIDEYPEYLFDWTYPIFMANEKGHQIRALRFKQEYHKDAWPGKRPTPQ
ncbi:MAG: hypothetical protein RL333_323 [Pseudomonadota bacterium]